MDTSTAGSSSKDGLQAGNPVNGLMPRGKLSGPELMCVGEGVGGVTIGVMVVGVTDVKIFVTIDGWEGPMVTLFVLVGGVVLKARAMNIEVSTAAATRVKPPINHLRPPNFPLL